MQHHEMLSSMRVGPRGLNIGDLNWKRATGALPHV
jgi:hypothetical protein